MSGLPDETQHFGRSDTPGESKLFGLSGRMWIGLMVVATVCGLGATGLEIKEPLHSGFLLILGAIFGSAMGSNRR